MPKNAVEAQQYVEELYNRRLSHSLNPTKTSINDHCVQNAAQLTTSIASSLGGGRFLPELLQNADDVHATEFSIELRGSELIVTHNGTPFSKNNVDKISDINNALVQSPVMARTGYKGVGVKAVFNVSEHFQITSGYFSFCFDKKLLRENLKNANNEFQVLYQHVDSLPWQIIPIWQPTSPVEAPKQNTTRFILKLKNTEAIKSEVAAVLKTFIEKPHLILFLKNIAKLKIAIDGPFIEISREALPDEINQRYILTTANGITEWLIKHFDIPFNEIDPKAISWLQAASKADCHPLLKKMAEDGNLSTRITLAAKVVNGQLMPVSDEENTLFCCLPTRQKFRVPVLVNGDFLFDTPRDKMTQNAWNYFLLRQVPYKILTWLRNLAVGQFQMQILQLFPKAAINFEGYISDKDFKDAYEEGHKQALADLAFLPAFESKGLLKVGQAVIDDTNYLQHFPEHLSEIETLQNGKKFLSTQLKNLSAIRDLLAKFGYSALLNVLPFLFGKQKDYFLMKRNMEVDYENVFPNLYRLLLYLDAIPPAWKAAFAEKVKPITLIPTTQENVYVAPNDRALSLGVEDTDIGTLSLPGLFFVNEGLIQGDRKNQIRHYLEHTLQIKPLNTDNTILKIFKLLKEENVGENRLAWITAYLVKHQHKLSIEQYRLLYHLPILTHAGPAKPAYLIKAFAEIRPPKNKTVLEKHGISLDGVVLDSYLIVDEELAKWNEFFLKITAISDFSAVKTPELKVIENFPIGHLPKMFSANIPSLPGINLGDKYLQYIKWELSQKTKSLDESLWLITSLVFYPAFDNKVGQLLSSNLDDLPAFFAEILSTKNLLLLKKEILLKRKDGGEQIVIQFDMIQFWFYHVASIRSTSICKPGDVVLRKSAELYFLPDKERKLLLDVASLDFGDFKNQAESLFAIFNEPCAGVFPQDFSIQHAQYLKLNTALSCENYVHILLNLPFKEGHLLQPSQIKLYEKILLGLLNTATGVSAESRKILIETNFLLPAEDNTLRYKKSLYCPDASISIEPSKHWLKRSADSKKLADLFGIRTVTKNQLQVKSTPLQNLLPIKQAEEKNQLIDKLIFVAMAQVFAAPNAADIRDWQQQILALYGDYREKVDKIIFKNSEKIDLLLVAQGQPPITIHSTYVNFDEARLEICYKYGFNPLTIPKICDYLAKYLKLHDRAKMVLTLALSMPDQQLYSELNVTLGYSLDYIQLCFDQLGLHINPHLPPPPQSYLPSLAQQLSPSVALSHRTWQQQIGDWGEAYCYHWLRQHYMSEKYKVEKIQDFSDKEFEVSGTKKGKKFYRKVTWLGSNNPGRDFTIIKRDENKGERELAVEIKTTDTVGEAEFTISKAQMETIKNIHPPKTDARLYRVYKRGEAKKAEELAKEPGKKLFVKYRPKQEALQSCDKEGAPKLQVPDGYKYNF